MSDIELALPTLGLALIRPAMVFAALPLAGMKPLPAVVQAGIALVLSLFALPHLVPLPANAALLPLILSGVCEAITGLSIALMLSVTISATRLAGEVVGASMGLGFSALIDPEHGTSVPTISEFFTLVAVALFMAFDGPVTVARLVLESYAAVPLGGSPFGGAAHVLTGATARLFATALSLSMPVLAATLGVQLALAVLTRLAPQINLFAVGFPATLIVGLIVLVLAFPVMAAVLATAWREAFATALSVVGGHG